MFWTFFFFRCSLLAYFDSHSDAFEVIPSLPARSGFLFVKNTGRYLYVRFRLATEPHDVHSGAVRLSSATVRRASFGDLRRGCAK